MFKDIVCLSYNLYKKIIDLKTIIIALSGGKDSLVLLLILTHISKFANTHLFIIHCHHFWQKNNFYTTNFIYKITYLTNNQLFICIPINLVSSEIKSRLWRKQVFSRCIQICNGNTIYLGHTASDQIETILNNLFRGSSSHGLVSIKSNSIEQRQNYFNNKPKSVIYQKQYWKLPISGHHNFKQQKSLSKKIIKYFSYTKTSNKIIRPLINISQERIKSILILSKLPNFTDKTNFDKNFTRIQIRYLLLPLIRNYNKSLTDINIKKFGQSIELDQYYFNNLLIKIINVFKENKIVNQHQYLLYLPTSLQNKLLFILIKQYSCKEPTYLQIIAIKSIL